MQMKKLICTVGLPRSGKSTWAKKQGHPMVNPDSIRLALHGLRFEKLAEPFVWAIAQCMVRALFLAGHDTVIIDATNITKNRRAYWYNGGDWETEFFIIGTAKNECIKRAEKEDDQEIIPIIEGMYLGWERDAKEKEDAINNQKVLSMFNNDYLKAGIYTIKNTIFKNNKFYYELKGIKNKDFLSDMFVEII